MELDVRPRGPYCPGLLGGGNEGLKCYGFAPTLLSSPVRLPDTLHWANISIIWTTSCNKDYAGRLVNTTVCAGVEGRGTDSREARADREPWKEGEERGTGLGVGMGQGFACFGPEKMLRRVFGDGGGRAVRMGVRLELGLQRQWVWVVFGEAMRFGTAWAGVENGYEFGLISDGKYVRVELGMGVNFVWEARDMTIGAGLCWNEGGRGLG